MTNNTRLLLRMVVSALAAGMISAFGILMQSVSETGEIKKGAIVIASLTGSIMVLKDVQSYLSSPPVFLTPPQPRVIVEGH